MYKLCKHCKIEKELTDFYTCNGSIRPRPECKVCTKLYCKNRYELTKKEQLSKQKQNRLANPRKFRNDQLKTRYGITIERYENILENQNFVCSICNQPETCKDKNSQKIKDLAVDHCHKTGKIRGLLCSRCNRGIGFFEDSVELLISAANYLKQ